MHEALLTAVFIKHRVWRVVSVDRLSKTKNPSANVRKGLNCECKMQTLEYPASWLTNVALLPMPRTGISLANYVIMWDIPAQEDWKIYSLGAGLYITV